ncbi:5486_t:CDS:2, partial [Cetraspora pellucida]
MYYWKNLQVSVTVLYKESTAPSSRVCGSREQNHQGATSDTRVSKEWYPLLYWKNKPQQICIANDHFYSSSVGESAAVSIGCLKLTTLKVGFMGMVPMRARPPKIWNLSEMLLPLYMLQISSDSITT